MTKRKPPPAAPAMTGTRPYEVLAAAAIKSTVQRFVSGYSPSRPALVEGLGVAVVALGVGLGFSAGIS